MKPKPFSALNHFTVPCATCAPTFRACGRPPWTWGPGYSLFRPSNTNVELEPRETVQGEQPPEQWVRAGLIPARDRASAPRPGGRTYRTPLADEPRRPDRLQRRVHPVGE